MDKQAEPNPIQSAVINPPLDEVFCQTCHQCPCCCEYTLRDFVPDTRTEIEMSEYSEGICEDGAAILKDGIPLTITEILTALRRVEQLEAKLEQSHRDYRIQNDEIVRCHDLLETKQEPVAWVNYGSKVILDSDTKKSLGVAAERWNIPLYTAPPAPKVQEELSPDLSETPHILTFTMACRDATLTAAPAMEDKRDAERYRWLVENAVIETDKWTHDGKDPSATKHPLDRAIDTAMENGKENPDDEYGREAYYDDQRKERGWE